MQLGAFSVSLSVRDIGVSRSFYEKLGFEVFGGDQEQNWLIMKNGSHTIGLFQGMFDGNLLTFNPGWDQDCHALDSFHDVRELRESFEKKGLTILHPSLDGETGPGSFSVVDPDGNVVLIDQHV